MKKIFTVITIAVMFSTAYAKNPMPTIAGIASLNIEKLQAVESNGEIFFMSRNGRYVIQGQMTDVWHKKKLGTLKEIDYASKHIDLNKMGLPVDELNVIKVGKGPKEIIAFVDPLCDPCKAFFKNALKYTSKYTFKFIVVPALGKQSNEMASAMFCAKDKTNLEKHFLERTLLKLEQTENCDKQFYNLTLTTAQLIGIKHVPFFISPSGLYQYGESKDFWQWVEKEG